MALLYIIFKFRKDNKKGEYKMCTALTYDLGGRFLGRNLDIERCYGENTIITPRSYPLPFKKSETLNRHYAMIGIGIVADEYPLYYDAVNEHGLAIAGLNFVGNAKHLPPADGKLNITPYEIIPYILATCKNIEEAKSKLEAMNVSNIPFNDRYPLAELHYIIADKSGSIVAEPCEDGVRIYDNPVGVMTNNPHFPSHLDNLNNYKSLSPYSPDGKHFGGADLKTYCLGLSAVGLPGDASSMSRFVRAAFNKFTSHTDDSEQDSMNQVFHLLSSVEQCDGSVRTDSGKYERTEYSAVINLDTATYYYRTYTNSRITAVRLNSVDINGSKLSVYPFIKEQSIEYQN